MSGRADPEGRTRRRLRELLESLDITNVELWPQWGAWRTNKRLDVYTFEGSAQLPPDANGYRGRVAVCSWSTMTEIVKSRGVIVSHDDRNSIMLHPSPSGISCIETT